MEIENEVSNDPTEPCWPFWGMLIYSKRAPHQRRPNHAYPLVSFYSNEDEFFNRFDRVAEEALEMLTFRSLDDLICSAREIQALINFEVESKMEREVEILVRTLRDNGGYQLKYFSEEATRTENDIRELLKNWRDEWDDDSGLSPRDSFSDMDELADYLEQCKYLDKERTKLGLIDPEEHEFFAVLILMTICNAIHKNRGAQRSPEFFDQSMALGKASIEAVEALAHAEKIQIVNRIRSAVASEQLAMVTAEIDKLDKERKNKVQQDHSSNGSKGGKAKHELTNELKVWALKNAQQMKCTDKNVAKRLSALLPPKFADVSKDPERLIYDALRAMKKARIGTSSQPTVTAGQLAV